jgi:Tfp pilus assembly protein PilZ
MSTTGAFIKTSHLLPVDAEFALNLQLPGDPEIMAIPGRVVWTKSVSSASPAGMGIQFTNILPHYQKKIAAFIEQNSHQHISTEAVKLYF